MVLANSRIGFRIRPETFKNSIKKVYKELNKPNLFTDEHPGISG